MQQGADVLLRSHPLSYLLPRMVPPFFTLGAAIYLVLTGSGDPVEIALLLFVVLSLAVLPIYLFVKARAQPWAIRIGTYGVTWYDTGHHLRWTSVVEVRVRARRKPSLLNISEPILRTL